MEVLELWTFVAILLSAFIIGWAAEAAQTFMPQALALSILAWLQTLPEFAVEASIAWHQQTDLMIANLTGSLRLLVGLGWPMIFFVQFFFQGMRKKKFIHTIDLEDEHFVSVFFLFFSVLYFVYVVIKGSLSCVDSVFLILLYVVYLFLITRFPAHETETPEDLPWIAQKIVVLNPFPKISAVCFLFLLGGITLYYTVHPFIETLQRWSVNLGISTFVFVQWIAPFLSEFPEKVSAFNWARQKNKASMAIMNMVSSNINQWTMLAAMIPLVFNLSLGKFEPIYFTTLHSSELWLTVAQSILAGILLLDLRFSFWDALMIFILWAVQFAFASLREEVTLIYAIWVAVQCIKIGVEFSRHRRVPRAVILAVNFGKSGGRFFAP